MGALLIRLASGTAGSSFSWQDAVRGRRRSATVTPVQKQQQEHSATEEDSFEVDGPAAMLCVDVGDFSGGDPKLIAGGDKRYECGQGYQG
jgi:hypothetical protein